MKFFRSPAFPASLAAAVALIVFAVTLRGTFVYDDFDVFQLDPRLHHPDQWGKYFTQSYNGGVDNLYRPVVSLSYAVQWWATEHVDGAGAGDSHAWPYHAVNWLLHAAVAACVAEVARRMSKRIFIGAVAGVLFAVHPVHVEAVANIVGRAELLCALGFFSAMILLLDRPLTIGRSIGILLCTLLSILSKEQGLLLAPVLLALAWANDWRPVDGNERDAQKLLVILMSWTLAGYVVFRESMLKFEWDRGLLDWTIQPLVLAKGFDKLLMPIMLLGHYAQLLVAPAKLSPDYGAKAFGWHASYHDPYLWIGMACIVAAIVALWLTFKFARMTFVCVLGLVLSVGLVSNIAMLIGTNFGERLMYLPSAFVVVLVAMALVRIAPRQVVIGVTILLAMLGAVRSITYARQWNDRLGFYDYTIARQPNSIRLRMLKVSELESQKRWPEAEREAASERALLPEYVEVWLQSCDVAMAQGKFDEAEHYLEQATKLGKSFNKIQGRIEALSARRAATRAS